MLSLITGPAAEPVSLAEAKLHLRVDDTEQDTLITSLIQAARQLIEAETGRCLCTQTWKWISDAFPTAGLALILPARPIQAVTEIRYLNDAGASLTVPLSNFEIVYPSGPWSSGAVIYPAVNQTWPVARRSPSSVQISFTAGYGLAVDVPAALKSALLLVLSNLFDNRDSQVSGQTLNPNPALSRLLGPYRAPAF